MASGQVSGSLISAGDIRTVWLDWEEEQRNDRSSYLEMAGPSLVTVLNALRTAVISAFEEDGEAHVNQAFEEYQQGAARMPDYAARFADVLAQSRQAGSSFTSEDAGTLLKTAASIGMTVGGHPGGVLGLGPAQLAATAQSGQRLSAAATRTVTGKKPGELTPQEYDLVTDPARELTRRAAAAVRTAGGRTPLMLLLDTGEIIGDRAWGWLRRVMIHTGPRVAWVIGARFETEAEAGVDSPVAQFVRDIGDEHLMLMSPTRFDDALIRNYLDSRLDTPGYTEAQIDLIARFTRGLPLGVSIAATLLKEGQSVEAICQEVKDGHPSSVVSQLARRYLIHAEQQDYSSDDPRRDDLMKILGLALAFGNLRDDPELLAALWNTTDPPLETFQDLARRHDFVLPGSRSLHDDVRDTLCIDLLDPYRRHRAREINQRALALFGGRLAEMQRSWPSLDEQLDHSKFTAALLAVLWHSFWVDNQAGLDLLAQLLPVLTVADWPTAEAAEAVVEPFVATFDQDQARDLLSIIGPSAIRDDELLGRWTAVVCGPSQSEMILPGLARLSGGQSTDVPAIGRPGDQQVARLVLRALLQSGDSHGNPAIATLRRAAALTTSTRLRQAIGSVAQGIADRLIWSGPAGTATPTGPGLAAAKIATEMLTGDASAWRSYAAALVGAGRFQEAADAYDQALTLDPDDATAHTGRGVALRALGQSGEALAAYNEALTLDPGNSTARYNQGNLLHTLGRFQEAVDAYDQALTLDPDNTDTHNSRGLALHALGRFQDAVDAYDQALTLNPANASASYNRGNALDALGRLQEAVDAYDQALTVDPDDASTHTRRGTALDALGRFQDAVDAYDQALTLDPGSAIAHTGRGNALHEMGRFQDAVGAYDQAITLDPRDADTHTGRGLALHALGRLPEAVGAYDQAITLDPGSVIAHNGRGNVLHALGRLQEAVDAYDQAITLDPGNAFPHENKGILLTARGDLDLALAELDTADRLAPTGAGEGRAWAGAILWHRQQDVEAHNQFSRVKGKVIGCTPFHTAEIEAIALCGLGQPSCAEQQVIDALPLRIPGDRAEPRTIYDLLSDPPLQGIDHLRMIIENEI